MCPFLWLTILSSEQIPRLLAVVTRSSSPRLIRIRGLGLVRGRRLSCGRGSVLALLPPLSNQVTLLKPRQLAKLAGSLDKKTDFFCTLPSSRNFRNSIFRICNQMAEQQTPERRLSILFNSLEFCVPPPCRPILRSMPQVHIH